MKVLFAIGSDKTSKLVVDKYYEKYGETLEYKNVFYFKAILKAIKEDKTYDRIVISEELEQFSSNNIEAIDKFLFGKIDELTDEIQDTDIILICSDRRQRGDPFLERLFSIGIYNVLLGDDRNFDPLCESIRRPKNKREAKEYLNINSVSRNMGGMVADDEVEEAQIINIIKHYERLGDNESSYVQSFDRIAEQYSRGQLKIIVKFLPPRVQDVLQNEEKYSYLFSDFIGQSQPADVQQFKPQTVYKPEKKGLFSIIRQNKNKEQENTKYEDKRVLEGRKRAETERAEQERLQKEEERLREQEEKLKQEQEKLRIENEKRKKEIEAERQQEELKRQEEDKRLREQEAERKRLAEERLKYENIDSNVIIENKDEKEKESLKDPIDSPIIDVTIPKNQTVTKEKPIRIIDEDADKKIEVQKPSAQVNNSSDDGSSNKQKLDEQQKMLEEKRQRELAEIAKKEEELRKQQEALRRAQEKQQEEMRRVKERQQEEFDTQRQVNIVSRQTIDKNLPSDYRKVVLFVGANKSGTTFIVNAISHNISEKGVNTALLDMTKDRSLYYIYNQDDYKLRQIASECMQNLIEGRDIPIPVTRRLNVYTALPGSSGENRKGYRHKAIIDTLKLKNSLIVIDADFTTPADYFEQASEIYIVQDLDILKLQETTLFLRELKNRKIDMSKIRIVVNKYVKTALTPKKIIEGLSYYNDPSMSFIDELLTSKVPYSVIPYDLDNYAQYIESLYKNEINYRHYTVDFINAIENLSAQIYPQNGIQKKNKRGLFG